MQKIIQYRGFEFIWVSKHQGFFTTGAESGNGNPVTEGVRILDTAKLRAIDDKLQKKKYPPVKKRAPNKRRDDALPKL